MLQLRTQLRESEVNRATLDVIERSMGIIVMDTNASKVTSYYSFNIDIILFYHNIY